MQDQQRPGSVPTLVEKGVRPSKSFTYYGITISKGGVLPQSLALKLLFPDGSQQAINYHELSSPMKFNGKTKIELNTPTLSIVIDGNHLEKLFDYILEHAVVWIEDRGESITEDVKGGVVIDSIKIEEKES